VQVRGAAAAIGHGILAVPTAASTGISRLFVRGDAGARGGG
jgi:hypothetical protein